MEDAISKHLELISKISCFWAGSTGEGAEDQTVSKSADREDNTFGGGDARVGENKDDEEDDDNEDQGADAEKRKKQICDKMEYDDGMEKKTSIVVDQFDGECQSGFESEVDQAEVEAEEDFEVGGDDPGTVVDEKALEDDSGTLADEETSVSPSRTEPSSATNASKSKAKKPKVSRRKKMKRAIFVEAKGLKFEAHFVLSDKHLILLAEIAQKTAKRVYVKESRNIDRCSVVEPKRSTDRISLQTAGVNFIAFWDLQDDLDVNRVVTNDIHAVLNTYGVEAARATIINEVKAVFEPYGIRVNTRHLSLIADFMSGHGGYRPMNRLGMMDFNTSPFSKMTFETATRFIVEAAFHGESDVLQSPSASVCLGQPVKFGTGTFDLLQKL